MAVQAEVPVRVRVKLPCGQGELAEACDRGRQMYEGVLSTRNMVRLRCKGRSKRRVVRVVQVKVLARVWSRVRMSEARVLPDECVCESSEGKTVSGNRKQRELKG